MMVENKGGIKASESVAAIEEIGKVVRALIDQVGPVFWKLIDLAKTNPLAMGLIGLILDDMLVHYGSHMETICVDCSAKNAGQTPDAFTQYLKTLGTGIAFGPLAFISPYVAASGGDDHSSHTYAQVKVPGIISATTNVQVGALILASFAIANAGAVISDVTAITDLAGARGDPASLVKPSVTTLVENGTYTGTGVQRSVTS